MKLVTAILALLLALGVIPTLAQDAHLYEDPAGGFSVLIPPDWMDESSTEIGRFVSSDDIAVSILAVEAADAQSGDQAVLTAILPDLAGTDPVQTTTQPGLNGTWAANIFVSASGRFVVLATQWMDGVTYAMVFDLPTQDALATNEGQLVSMFKGFSIGERLDLTGVKAKPFTAEMLADLEAYIDDARQRFHVPGVSVAIVQNGKVVYTNGFGTTGANDGQPVTADTLFRIGSINKSMTTMMMGTLVDDGILNWDQPVTDILPSFALSDPAATAKIRIRDLVNMSSGVPSYDTILAFRGFSPPELFASLAKIPLVAAPGETWNYSNQMFAAGGYISALAAGAPKDEVDESYVNLVQKRIFDPIGMSNTTFDFDAVIDNPNHALPTIFNPFTQKYSEIQEDRERFVDSVAPSGKVWSNAHDMARYLQTELSSGLSPDGKRVISEAELHTTQSIETAGFYGMGWFIDSYKGARLIWHGGNTAGFSSDLAFLPSADLGVVTLSNAWEVGRFNKSVREYVFEMAYGLEHDSSEQYAAQQAEQDQSLASILPLLPDAPVDPTTVASYVGTYENGISVEMRGNELWLVGAYVQASLHPAGDFPGTAADDYIGRVDFNLLQVRFLQADGHITLQIINPSSGEILNFKAA